MFVVSGTNICKNFISILRKILKEQLKIYFLMCSNACDDVKDIKVCGLIKIHQEVDDDLNVCVLNLP